MKLGEIKIEALKLMFATGNRDVGVSDLEGMVHEEEYADYLLAMPGAVNRCFAVLEERRVLPTKSYTMKSGCCDAATEIPDFFDVDRIVYDGPRGYDSCCEYAREGDLVFITNYDAAGTYRLLYKPSLKRIGSLTSEEYELDIPDRIACLIPYYIKGDAFRIDEVDEAQEAFNRFEAALLEISKREDGVQQRVSDRYSFMEV